MRLQGGEVRVARDWIGCGVWKGGGEEFGKAACPFV